MRKIPHPVERKILHPLTHSEHEVMLSFQRIVEEWLNGYDEDALKKLNQWLDDLQEMYDKASRLSDLEYNLSIIEGLADDADNAISDIRGYTNV